MAGSHEKLKQAEETAHVGSKHIGLTMALIGVLIALCVAMASSKRNELARTMIEQTQAHSDYAGASTKFRIVMLELEKLHAGSSVNAANTAQLPELKRFLRLYLDYDRERALAETWFDSYKPVIAAQFNAGDDYEDAQLVAEIAIVIASLAVLLSNRLAWFISIFLAVICIGMTTSTFVKARPALTHALATVRKTEDAYQQLRKAHLTENEDERTIEELDPGGMIRAEIGKNAQPRPSPEANHR
jgi:Domain of unknown function (DUF4337)